MRRAIVVGLVGSTLFAIGWLSAQGTNARIDSIFEDMDRTDTPGAAVAVVQGTQVVYLKGYGMANLEHGIPITSSTVFDIASISKQFGAMTAIVVEQEGKIRFDDRARSLVPELPAFGESITLRHLIHHTSGIRDWPQAMVLSGVGMGDVISFEQIKKMLFRQEALNFPAGSAYAYSNTGYNLLAEALARVTGKSFPALAEERIFCPLHMVDTHFSDDHNQIVPRRAASYEPDEAGGFKNSTNQLTALASSSLHTTIEDFTKWMVNYETKAVGGPVGLRQLHERGVLADGTAIPYAFGVVHGEYRGLATVSHGGSWRGFRTHFLRFPAKRLSIAVFANFSTSDPATRAQRIAETYLADELGEPSAVAADSEMAPRRLELSESALREFEGTYYSRELDTSYELRVVGTELIADHWRNERVHLHPVAPDAFRSPTWWFRELAFSRNAQGRVDGFGLTGERVHNLRFDRRNH